MTKESATESTMDATPQTGAGNTKAGWGVVGLTVLGMFAGIALVVLSTIALWGSFPGERYFLGTVAATVYAVEIMTVGASMGLVAGYALAMRFFKLGQPHELAKPVTFFGSLVCGMALVFCFCWHNLKLWLPCIIWAALVPVIGSILLKRTKSASSALTYNKE